MLSFLHSSFVSGFSGSLLQTNLLGIEGPAEAEVRCLADKGAISPPVCLGSPVIGNCWNSAKEVAGLCFFHVEKDPECLPTLKVRTRPLLKATLTQSVSGGCEQAFCAAVQDLTLVQTCGTVSWPLWGCL
jgi:hypothetical protein